MAKLYYHGSQSIIKNHLEPHKSKVVDGDKVVFATNTKWLALVFIAHSTDSDIEIGFIKNMPYILEQYPGAFDKLLNVSGYLYHVDPKLFASDKRLGMKNHEFISYEKVPIVKKEKINNVYNALKKTEVNIITFEDKIKCLYAMIKKTNNRHH